MKVSFGAEMTVKMAWRESSDLLLLLATRFLHLEGNVYRDELPSWTIGGTLSVKDCSFTTDTLGIAVFEIRSGINDADR